MREEGNSGEGEEHESSSELRSMLPSQRVWRGAEGEASQRT